MEKRFLKGLCLLLAALLLPLCACGSGTVEAPATPSPEPTAAPSPSTAPELSPTPEPEPEPDYDLTTPEGRAAALGLPAPPEVAIDSWEFRLANAYNSIIRYAVPSGRGLAGGSIDRRAYDDGYALIQAAREAGYNLRITQGILIRGTLLDDYEALVRSLGSAQEAVKVMAPPDVNEHQTGLGIDLVLDRSDPTGIFGTEALDWLMEHCAEYGFIFRYPEGKEDYYGYDCRLHGAHFRYVGQEAAAYIMENDLCLEEFLRLYDPEAAFVPFLDAPEWFS